MTSSTSVPADFHVPVATVRDALRGARKVVFLDDDPTGTQTVRDLPVLTRWTDEDVEWALGRDTAGFFVLTNTRSLDPHRAAERDRQVVQACVRVAAKMGVELAFASRSDSTLRGHFPLEIDVIGDVLAESGTVVDGVLLAPAYVDAGRLTLDGVHVLRVGDELVPVAESDFARDATFGYRSSRLSEWVAEKSGGRIGSHDVIEISLETIRTATTSALARRLADARDRQVVVVDAMTDDDLRAVALAVLAAERDGARLVYRIGPSFVRARTGQEGGERLSDQELWRLVGDDVHGLVVVGSHVPLTTRQLDRLAARRSIRSFEVDVDAIVGDDGALDGRLEEVARHAADALSEHTVVVSTSRLLAAGADEAASLDISRRVSTALSTCVARIVTGRRPAFVIAKGGITSSDIATRALRIDRAWTRGPVLDGIVSLWQAVSGPAAGIPYVVFPGNVGDDDALADVVSRLEDPS
ncbi:four-carbon acid sugar kinase family protein [Mycobacterium sp. NPDC006124]|uniref:four-carbon acid sugar kinase family protein n=1 Tax=Mycobacterium sp. NPDC006124 TaxID=3156729 RepID=UPI0033A1AE05